MRREVILLMSFALALMFARAGLAADNGFYVGASAGQSSFAAGDLADVDFEGDATGYKVFAGVRLITFVAVEASYVDFGSIEGDLAATGWEADMSGYTLEAVGFLPLGIADVFVKVGMLQWDADLSNAIAAAGSLSMDGNDPVYGVGIQFHIGSFAVRGEVEYFDVRKADTLYMYSLGGSFTF